MVEESILDELDNGILSEGFMELNLNKHFDDVSGEELDVNDPNDGKKKNIQDPKQSLDEVEEKQAEIIEDSQLGVCKIRPDRQSRPKPVEPDQNWPGPKASDPVFGP
jgi:hypothetical protein